MRTERWELVFTDLTPGKLRFRLTGSRTGDDGEGTTTGMFVSKSGRITVDPRDWLFIDKYQRPEGTPLPALIFQIVEDFRDEVCWHEDQTPSDGRTPRTQYVTVADGLTPGEHELTLVPSDKGTFSIQAIEAYNPPLKP